MNRPVVTADLERLAKIAGLIGSSFEAEAIAAARKLHEACQGMGISLSDLILGNVPAMDLRPAPIRPVDPTTSRHFWRDPASFREKAPQHRAHVDACFAALDLNDWERDFLANIRNEQSLSDRQALRLKALYNRALNIGAAA